MRCADFGPTPGRRPSSSISAWTGAAYGLVTRQPSSPPRLAEVEAAGDAAEALALHLLGAAQAVAHRREHEVFEHLDVVGIDDLRRDAAPTAPRRRRSR